MTKFNLNDLEYGTLNNFGEGVGNKADRRRDSSRQYLERMISNRFGRHALKKVNLFVGVVIGKRQLSRATFQKKGSVMIPVDPANSDGTVTDAPYFVYKVYIPELESRPYPLSGTDPVIATYQDVYITSAAESKHGELPLGGLVSVRYVDRVNLIDPMIVDYEGAIPLRWAGEGGNLNELAFKGGYGGALGFGSGAPRRSTTGGSLGPALPASGESPGDYEYPPGSEKLTKLLKEALTEASLPLEWADWQATHNLIKRESGGKVGIPNYTYKSVASNIEDHPEKWEELIWPLARAGTPGTYEGRSTATGLGQLLTSNVKKFYPGGTTGIGKPLSEAVGFVRYVYYRYGDPKVAWSVYGKGGKGAQAVTFTNSRTGKVQQKTFEEGY